MMVELKTSNYFARKALKIQTIYALPDYLILLCHIWHFNVRWKTRVGGVLNTPKLLGTSTSEAIHAALRNHYKTTFKCPDFWFLSDDQTHAAGNPCDSPDVRAYMKGLNTVFVRSAICFPSPMLA
jgi:hypothetical protein